MEKCSFCVQRIQYGKLEAKLEGRRPKDGEINVACAESCPSEALVFGDLNDPESRINKMMQVKEDNGNKVIQEDRIEMARQAKARDIYLPQITDQDIDDLIAFLNSLTGEAALRQGSIVPTQVPSKLPVDR